MADRKLIEIPADLTDKEWQKKKGKLTKLVGETGVGAAMKKLDVAWKKVDWEQFAILHHIQSKKDPRLVDDAKEVAFAYVNGKQISDLRKSIQEVSAKASAAEKKFKGSKLVPKSATVLAANTAKLADQYFVAVGAHGLFFSASMKEFDAKKKNLEQIAALAKTEATKYVVSIENFAKEVLKNPTAKEYIGEAKTGFFQNTRGMQAALAVLMKTYPDAKPLRDGFSKVSQDGFKPNEDATADEIRKKVTQVILLNQEVKKFVKQLN